jgi:hypothetical protein
MAKVEIKVSITGPIAVVDSQLTTSLGDIGLGTTGARSPLTVKTSLLDAGGNISIDTGAPDSAVAVVDSQLTTGKIVNLGTTGARSPLTVKTSLLGAFGGIAIGAVASDSAVAVVDSQLEASDVVILETTGARSPLTVKNSLLQAVIDISIRTRIAPADVGVTGSIFLAGNDGVEIISVSRTAVVRNNFTGVAGAPGSVEIEGAVSCLALDNIPAGIGCH